MRGVVERLVGVSLRHPRTVVALGIAIAILGGGLGVARVELRTSNLDLIDPGLPPVKAFRDFAEEFGTTNLLVVVLEGEDEEALGEAVRRLGPLLRRAHGVRGVLDRLDADAETLDALGVDEFLMSYDHGLFFVFVQPEDPHSSVESIAPFVGGVRAALAGAHLEELGVRAGLTGLPQYALDDRETIRGDISLLSALSALLVAGVFVVGFRSLRRPLLAMATLLLGVGATLGVVAVVPGHLTLLSAFCASILFGLGVDFGIHVVARVEELEATGVGEEEAVVRALRSLAPGLVTGAGTTAVVFFSMLASGFRGFAELGFIAGVGVLLCLLVTVVVLPALLALGSRGASPRARRLPSPGRWLVRLYRPRLAVLVGALVLAGVFAGGPGFDADYLNLQPAGSEAVRLERAMVERSDLSPQFAAFVTASRDEALRLSDRLLDDPTVGEVHSVVDLDELVNGAGRPLAVARTFRESLASRAGRFAVYAYPEGDAWDPRVRDEFLAHMEEIDPRVTGMPVLGRFMVERSRRAMLTTATLGGALLLLCVFADLRRPLLVAVAVAPALLTVGALDALLRLVGVQWNPIDVMALPVVIGIAVDDGVHMVHRFLEEGGDVGRTLSGTGRGVALTSLTTMAAFGSLCFAAHRGLRSFAVTLTLGVATSLLLSLVVLPGLLALTARFQSRRPRLEADAAQPRRTHHHDVDDGTLAASLPRAAGGAGAALPAAARRHARHHRPPGVHSIGRPNPR